MTETNRSREELEARAEELGVKFGRNIGDDKLAERVAEKEAELAAGENPLELAARQGGQTASQPKARQTPPGSGLDVVVVGPQGGFRRAGRRFGPEPVRIPLDALSEAEKAALIAEPRLVVTTEPALAGDD